MYALAPRGSNIKEFGELVRGFSGPVEAVAVVAL
jgi:hypothetical protein